MHPMPELYQVDFMLSHGFYAYVLRERNGLYEYITPFMYTWMQKQPIPQWEALIETFKIDKKGVSLTRATRSFTYDDWIFTYPIDKHTLPHFQDIDFFFETFLWHPTEPLSAKLERTIQTVEKRLPVSMIESLVTFVCTAHRLHPERLRLMTSPLITAYRKRGE